VPIVHWPMLRNGGVAGRQPSSMDNRDGVAARGPIIHDKGLLTACADATRQQAPKQR
jgi:hypothetical protein